MATGIVSTFVPLYLIDALHASHQQIALLNSLPALTGLIASLLGALWIPRLTLFRTFSVATIFATRLTYLLLALVPLATPYAAGLVVDANALANFPQTLGNLGWQALIAKLIPSSMRESFFGRRNVLITIVGLAGTIVTGALLQFFNPHAKLPYQAVFVGAFLLGAIEVWYLARHREPVRSTDRPRPLEWSTFGDLWRHVPYRRYVLLAAFFNFGWQMSWPLFSIFQISTAHATGLWVGAFTMATQAAEVLTFAWWGMKARLHGGMKMLGIAGLGVSLVPILTVLSPNLWYLTGVNFFSGIFLSGVTLLLFTELLHASPPSDRSTAIAFYNVVLGVVAFVAPEVGIVLLRWIHMEDAMLISTLWRAAGSLFFLAPLIGTIRSRIGQFSASA
ncbi:MFS transporter [Sulfobacillus harzensis]|uniref:MFS transporter n=1 Tax=Sulfobacillus harzensis TaxID=2729629 RepID=A0A7Y0Q5F4_9FIRM|nr:MFS transporter [Sulfobacillus harzensis]NMP24244.1 MFS transporter [Sulfobacillus harzensis]